ncbi:hypothetical protein UC34_25430 [Pandoraea vervacti]|uniref:Uncharacterized protein n=1 Tax=Pandoraea vervacti TaxID=656178 RepID=A0ABM6FRG2_9BURK|nr:hypothetical protein UC34_25430 [Pandoraea vervacti]
MTGAVIASSADNHAIACTRSLPHISREGCNDPHTAGRCGLPKIWQRSSSSSCTQRVFAGLPFGMPGMGVEMEGAMQQAAQ